MKWNPQSKSQRNSQVYTFKLNFHALQYTKHVAFENTKLKLTAEQVHHIAYCVIMVYKWEYKFPLEFGSSVLEVISDIQKKDPIWAAVRMIYSWLDRNPCSSYLAQLSFIKAVFKKLFTKEMANQIIAKIVSLWARAPWPALSHPS